MNNPTSEDHILRHTLAEERLEYTILYMALSVGVNFSQEIKPHTILVTFWFSMSWIQIFS